MNDTKLILTAGKIGVASIGAGIAAVFGGWDGLLKVLICCMAVDYLTGIAVAGIGKSSKSASGRISSSAAVQGIVKKGVEWLIVLIAAQLTPIAGGSFIRDAVVCFFIGSEGLSLVENAGLLGVPIPKKLKKMFEALKEEREVNENAEKRN